MDWFDWLYVIGFSVTLPISGRVYRLAGLGKSDDDVPPALAAIFTSFFWPVFWFVMLCVGLKKIRVFKWLNYAITGERP